MISKMMFVWVGPLTILKSWKVSFGSMELSSSLISARKASTSGSPTAIGSMRTVIADYKTKNGADSTKKFDGDGDGVIDGLYLVYSCYDYQRAKQHEKKYGNIPEGSFVALRSDWSKRWPDGDKLSNADVLGNEHFPGWTLETLKFLIENRKIAGNGHETLDTDASVGAMREGDLACERYVLEQGKFQLEILDNLDQLPAVGAVIFIAFPRIENATGLPARVWAITE